MRIRPYCPMICCVPDSSTSVTLLGNLVGFGPSSENLLRGLTSSGSKVARPSSSHQQKECKSNLVSVAQSSREA